MRKIIALVFALALWIPNCHAIEFPQDLPTIEALIDLHKDMKHAEDRAVENIALSYGEHGHML